MNSRICSQHNSPSTENIVSHRMSLQLTKRLLLGGLVFLTLPLTMAGCKKFVTVDPPTTGLVSTTIYTNNATAAAAVTGIYSRLSTGGLATGNASLSLYAGLAADELTNYSSSLLLDQLYTNKLVPTSTLQFWSEIYRQLYVTNSVLEGLEQSTGVTAPMRNQLKGEALFMRGFLQYYAASLFGDVPVVTSSDYRINNTIDKTAIEQVYAHVIADLISAKDLLSEKYLTASGAVTTDRVRPNKIAALALLARVYLCTKQWAQAEAAATEVLSKTTDYFLLTDLTKVFLTGSKEAIWQLQPVVPGYNTQDGYYYMLTSMPGTDRFSVSLSQGLVKTFDATDARLSKWVGVYKNTTTNVNYYYPFKYKVGTYSTTQPVTESLMVLRVAEQFLIRAEARAYQSNWSGAGTDLGAVRSRAGLGTLSLSALQEALTAINRERQLELFTEWGHRWLDLKRTGNIDAVMDTTAPIKGSQWRKTDKLFPIPQTETLINPKLTQNDGY